MLEAGFGISVLPMIGLPVAGHPSVVSRPLVEPALVRVVGAYRCRDRSPSPAAGALLDVIRDVVRTYSSDAGGDATKPDQTRRAPTGAPASGRAAL